MCMVAVAFLIKRIVKTDGFLQLVQMTRHLTRKMMMGEMISTSSRIAIPRACCWFAAFSSLFTVNLKQQ